MTDSISRLAKILRADKDFIVHMDSRLSKTTGKKGVLEKIAEENDREMDQRLKIFNLTRSSLAKDVYNALIRKIQVDDEKLQKFIGKSVYSSQEDCARILELARRVAVDQNGFFLKKEKAEQFLMSTPPENVLRFLGYSTVKEMLAHEDLFEVYSALRFIEGAEWLNTVFFKQYETLTVADFEERPIVVRALSTRWNDAAAGFIKKKWHNISHLKELGVAFVIPVSLGIPGELLRMLSLVFHYLHEIPFYSDLFEKSAQTPSMFSSNVVSLLRGDVFDRRIPEGEKSMWLVVQRYLAKDDENDWRLFYPHVNPEALHWVKAEDDLINVGNLLDGFGQDLAFWKNLDWVGDYFKDEAGMDVLVSFNLVDTVMSLVMEKEFIKYLYHHQETLWNKIFSEYFSDNELETFIREYVLQGYFEI